jgi:membrane-bound lytic murein transglycosylase D
VSYKRATGMWQFMKDRGREYGLNQTGGVDDRLDPEKATRAAARHLRDLYAGFGDWYLAMAAYNCGPGCVDRAVQRTGYADFWELTGRNALPQQTLKYVPLILAITIMSKNPKDYGLENIEPERPLEYDTMDLKSATNLNLIADVTDRPVSEIRDLNPALLTSIAPDGYPLHVPKGSSTGIAAGLASVPLDRRATWRVHRVETGETLTEIAARFRTAASAIAAANNRTVEAPEAGDILVIPALRQSARVARRISPTQLSTHARAARNTYASHRISPEVLYHRAAPRTVKTAGVYGHSASGQ